MQHILLVILVIWQALLIETQFRGFRSRTEDSNNNHDLLKQIVDHTPEEDHLKRFSPRRPSNILDRAKFRSNTFGSGRSNRPRFTPSFPRFGSNTVDIVTANEDSCSELKSENELLKQLVSKLQKQVEELQTKLRRVPTPARGQNSNPLSLISEALRSRLGLGDGQHNNVLLRDPIKTKQPIITSTIVTDTSYESLLTTSVTRDLSVLFQGRYSTTFVWDTLIQTSTITDQVTSVVTISPASVSPSAHLATISPTLSGHTHQPHNQDSQDSLDSFETLRGYLNQFKNKLNVENHSSTTTTQQPPSTTQIDILRKHLGRRKDLYKARFFSPNKDYIKEQISSSLYGPSEVTLEPSFHTVSSSYSLASSSSLVIETSPLAPSLASLQQQQPSIIVNVASNVRVETGSSESTVTSQAHIHDNVSEVTQATAASSIVTLYLSGSVPGVFSTSLSTIYYADHAGTSDPSDPAPQINPTQTVKL